MPSPTETAIPKPSRVVEAAKLLADALLKRFVQLKAEQAAEPRHAE